MINYVTGDATRPPPSDGVRCIAHVCNDEGGWGAGFVLALSKRDEGPEEEYRRWSREHTFGLSQVQLVSYAESGLFVANMIAQHAFGEETAGRYIHPIRYIALSSCLFRLHRILDRIQNRPVSVHMPRIGCGLAGGKWEQVEPLINKFLCDRGIPVTVYDLPPKPVVDIGEPAQCCGTGGCTPCSDE